MSSRRRYARSGSTTDLDMAAVVGDLDRDRSADEAAVAGVPMTEVKARIDRETEQRADAAERRDYLSGRRRHVDMEDALPTDPREAGRAVAGRIRL